MGYQTPTPGPQRDRVPKDWLEKQRHPGGRRVRYRDILAGISESHVDRRIREELYAGIALLIAFTVGFVILVVML